MKSKMISTMIVILLGGFLLLSLLTSNTYSFIQQEKKLDFYNNYRQIDENSQDTAQMNIILSSPQTNPEYVRSVLPGPFIPSPDTTRNR